jgi:predicted nucleic acid-binding protein
MLLCDTGPLVAAAIVNDPDHHVCVELLRQVHLERRVIAAPATVIAETGYLLGRLGTAAVEASFLKQWEGPGFVCVQLRREDFVRAAQLVEQYASFPLGTTDASVIAVAERLGQREIATLDCRHFLAVRPKHTPNFTLLPGH